MYRVSNDNTDFFLSFTFAQHTINHAITLPHSNQKWLPVAETQVNSRWILQHKS